MPKRSVYGPPRRSGGQKGNLNALKFLRKADGEGDGRRNEHGSPACRASRNPKRELAAASDIVSNDDTLRGLWGAQAPLSNLDRIIVIKTRQIGGRL